MTDPEAARAVPAAVVRHALFDTALGVCGIAWTAAGVCRVALPGASAERTAAHLGGAAAPPPASIRRVIDGVSRLLAGEAVDLSWVPLDLSQVNAFGRRVYELTRDIPPGSTISYGELAARLGQPGAARAVGRALGENPCPIVVPCHRVLAADGSMHGFSAPGGLATKRRMLQLEGALAPDPPTLF
ncbi:MAG TPA: methylated-DNA--[protein]-cysteine S-methyltransferase [Jatrophihabitans sp.]|nr:methylated-DNA--[protein]-cysteine S-methyltransferase [Jatrophihabitans sp.]